jgi:hypothetical protein
MEGTLDLWDAIMKIKGSESFLLLDSRGPGDMLILIAGHTETGRVPGYIESYKNLRALNSPESGEPSESPDKKMPRLAGHFSI